MVYLDILKFNLSRSFVYPYEVVSAFVRKFVSLSMILLFWYTLSKSSDITLNVRELLSYFLIATSVGEIVMTSNLNFGRNIQRLIKTGNLSNYTIKPLNTELFLMFSFIGERGVSFVIATISILVGVAINPPVSILNVILFFVYLILAFGISFGINLLVASIGFLTPDAGSIKNVILHLLRVLSGALVPLTYFPATLRKILMLSPFPFLAFAPTNALISSEISSNLGLELLVGLFWAIILPIISLKIWKSLFKKYDAIGI